MKTSWLLAGVVGFVLAMVIAVGIVGGVYFYGLVRRNNAPAAQAPAPQPAPVPAPAPANPVPANPAPANPAPAGPAQAAPQAPQPNVPVPQQPPQDAPLAPLPGVDPNPQVPPAGQPAAPGIAPAPQPAQPQPAGPQLLPLPQQPPGGPAQEPDVAMARYRHPSGTFGIEYPDGWKIRSQSGAAGTTFYKDDPDEGTSFTVVAMQPAQGELKARQIFQAVAAAARKQYPDLRVKPGALRNLGSPGAVAEMLEAEAWWTNVRGRKMQAAVLIIATTSPGAGFTSFTFLSGQAPITDFPAMRPIYQRMMQSMGPGT